ncbi:hypothetical protein DK68_3203 [Brucella suis]|nr:hypothetical protein DK68_3203 [Brucella suis]KFJ37439.1 hypothetical protein DK66_3023 [Brucella suis 1330]KFJ62812.1 hypothetical protein DK59_3037 [Brucella abortus bv. 4 str. 292]
MPCAKLSGFDQQVTCGLRSGDTSEVPFHPMLAETKVEFLDPFTTNPFWLSCQPCVSEKRNHAGDKSDSCWITSEHLAIVSSECEGRYALSGFVDRTRLYFNAPFSAIISIAEKEFTKHIILGGDRHAIRPLSR